MPPFFYLFSLNEEIKEIVEKIKKFIEKGKLIVNVEKDIENPPKIVAFDIYGKVEGEYEVITSESIKRNQKIEALIESMLRENPEKILKPLLKSLHDKIIENIINAIDWVEFLKIKEEELAYIVVSIIPLELEYTNDFALGESRLKGVFSIKVEIYKKKGAGTEIIKEWEIQEEAEIAYSL